MRLFILLSAFIYCVSSETLKNELLTRAKSLEDVIQKEVKALHAVNKEHLAGLLNEEEKRLQTLAKELEETAETDLVKNGILEDRLITLEYRVINELNILTRETQSAELLLNNAKVLKQWVDEEIKTLENTEGPHRRRAHEAARVLRREEHRLLAIIDELMKSQNLRRIATLEVELRSIEVRLYETLRELHFHPSTSTPAPHTGSTRPHVTVTHATARPTVHATTRHATARPTVRATTKHVIGTTLSPIELKNMLVKRAAQLQATVKSEIAKLKSEGKTAQVAFIQNLDTEVLRIADRLQKTSQVNILQLLESELYWLESRLTIEVQAIEAQEQRGAKLIAIASALKQRIISVLKVLANTPVGNALLSESKTLDNISVGLKKANNDKTLDDLELQLASVENRVNQELKPIGVSTDSPI